MHNWDFYSPAPFREGGASADAGVVAFQPHNIRLRNPRHADKRNIHDFYMVLACHPLHGEGGFTEVMQEIYIK